MSAERLLLSRRPRWALSLLVLAWGMQAIVTQSLLLREAVVLMFGSELAWGIVLFAWLLGVAIGAGIGGYLSKRSAHAAVTLALALLGLSVVTCIDLWAFRGARDWLGVRPGELLPLPKTALAALAFIPPASAFVGLAFPLACCVVSPTARARKDSPLSSGGAGEDQSRDRNGAAASPYQGSDQAGRDRSLTVAALTEPHALDAHEDSRASDGGSHANACLLEFGQVYALESAGSLVGGAAFSFWAVDHLAPVESALICGAITVVATAALAAAMRRRTAAAGLAAIAAALLLTALLGGSRLNFILVERRWKTVAPGYQLCAEAESRYQNSAVGRRENQYSLYCNGQIAADFPDPYTFVPLAHFWMCQHPSPRRVLVLGGGAEGLLAEILRHPVKNVDYVEPDPRQIDLIAPYLADVDREALRSPRLTVHHQDARYFVKSQQGRFDLVIARLPEPTSALRARFYTDEFYGELRRAMSDQAVLCTTVTASPGELSAMSAEYVGSIRATIRRHFSEVVVCWGDPAHVLVATSPGLVSTDPAVLTQRYKERGVQTPMFNPLWFEGATDWLEADKLAQRSSELDAADVTVSADLRPAIYLQRLALWERMMAGQPGGFVERLRAIRISEAAAGIAVLAALTLAGCWFRGMRSGPRPRAAAARSVLVLSVATTGFVTMALSIIWLFAFQNLYGYVYQRIGWIIALFMAGLVIGCWGTDHAARNRAARHCSPRGLWTWLIVVDAAMALLALSVPPVLRALEEVQSTLPTAIEVAISILVAATGVLCGAAFPLAAALYSDSGPTGATAGAVVAADHFGACLGALATGILLVPVFGTAAAALLLAGIKLAAAVLLLSGRSVSPPTT